MIWVTADHHFGHHSDGGGSILRYESRPFKTILEMDEALIEAWNHVIAKRGDIVYHLGDFSFYPKARTQEILSRLHGNKVLVMGNHDHARSRSWWLDAGFSQVIATPIILDSFFILSHEPVYLNVTMPYANLHGHLHSKTLIGGAYLNVGVDAVGWAPITFEQAKSRLRLTQVTPVS